MPIFASHKRFIQLITNIRAYKKELNLVVVTGKNDSLFKKLEKDFTADKAGLILLKNSNSIDEWMRVADAIVSKAGGLTISEALCLQKPIIVINPIPGQEEYNTIYLEENKYGTEAQSRQDVVKKIDALITGKFVTNKKSYSDPSKIILLQSLN